MKKSLANQIERLWNEKHAGSYGPTRTKAVVMEGGRTDDFSVEIIPDKGNGNDGSSFHHQEEMTDVTRAFKVSSYVALSTIDGAQVVIGRFF